ncbi:hypothetical protein D3C85_586140 [compost metagenome]
MGQFEVLQRLLQLEQVVPFAAQQDVEATTIAKAVVAVAPFQEVIALAAAQQVVAVGTDDEGAAGVGFTTAAQVFDPGAATGALGQGRDEDRRVLVGEVVERRVDHPVQAIGITQ